LNIDYFMPKNQNLKKISYFYQMGYK
jgi:hypothetical protein